MVGKSKVSPTLRTVVLTAGGVTATLSVFVADILLPHGFDVTYLYALTVIVAAFSRRRTTVFGTMLGVWVLSATAFAVKGHDHPHGVNVTEVFSRSIAVVVIALIAVVVSIVMKRETENDALGRALRTAEGDRDNNERMIVAASAVAAIGTWSMGAGQDQFHGSSEASNIWGFAPGYTPSGDEVLGLMSVEDAARVHRALEGGWVTGAPFREEFQITRSDGAVRWIVAMGEPLRDEEGTVVRLHGTVQDITPWKDAELAAADHGHRFSQLTRSLPIIVWTADKLGHVNYFNDALPQYTGLSRQDLENDGWISTVEPSAVDELFEKWDEAI